MDRHHTFSFGLSMARGAILGIFAFGASLGVQATTCANAIVINPASIPITNQNVSCGATDDLNWLTITNFCGDDFYMDGYEALYTLTPTITGSYTISYSGQSWSGIFVYAGCPTGTGSCVGNITNSTAAKSLTVSLNAGTTYFIWFDTWPSPISPCPGTFSISAPTPPSPPPGCGEAFYDEGGPTGDYPVSSNWVQTYCPDNPGDVVTLLFNTFNVENGWAFLEVFNGPNTAAPLLGTYTGDNIPPPITSSHPSGCITIRFTCDAFSYGYPGWSGIILCDPLPTGDCIYALILEDSGNNGWGSSNVGVRINGGAWTYYTVTGGVNVILLGVTLGDLIEIIYDNSGPNQNQNRYSIGRLGQAPYFTSNQPPEPGITFSQIVNCGPPPAQPQDCIGGITVCSDISIINNATDWGETQDLNASNRGCLLANEMQGTWYYFSPSSGGTLGFTITPASPIDDYDFAVWGPYDQAQCPNDPPVRCSWYDGWWYDYVITGMGNGATDAWEGAGPPNDYPGGPADGWVSTLNVVAGKVYVLYIDNYSQSGQAFTLDWSLTNGASLDCTTLPVEMLTLDAQRRNRMVDVIWATASEHNTLLYEVQRSTDNRNWEYIGTMGAAGNSQYRTDYLFVDEDPIPGINYYRLKQVDTDGTSDLTHAVMAYITTGGGKPAVFPNPATENLRVAFTSPMGGDVRFHVLDATGRIVSGSMQPATAGEQHAELPIGHLAKGWYNLRVILPDGTPLRSTGFVKE